MTVTLPRPWVTRHVGERPGATIVEWAMLLDGHGRDAADVCASPRDAALADPAALMVHPVLAAALHTAGTFLADQERQELLGLLSGIAGTGPRGTQAAQDALHVRLAVWSARQVLPDAPHDDRPALRAALDRLEANVVDAPAFPDAWVADRLGVPQQQSAAGTMIRLMLAHLRYPVSAGGFAAQDMVALIRPGNLFGVLTGLIGEYDRLTGRGAWRAVSEEDLASLAVLAALEA